MKVYKIESAVLINTDLGRWLKLICDGGDCVIVRLRSRLMNRFENIKPRKTGQGFDTKDLIGLCFCEYDLKDCSGDFYFEAGAII